MDGKVKERPMLFSGPMVRAILDGRKTQTRRVIKPQPELNRGGLLHADFGIKDRNGDLLLLDANHDGKFAETCKCCPYGIPGERLWVRETFSTWHHGCHWHECTREGRSEVSCSNCFYRATHHFPDDDQKWVPSIFMPRWASRITLEITGVRVERLQDISPEDALAEGVAASDSDYEICKKDGRVPVIAFAKLWQSINGPSSWCANPWVWVIEFNMAEA